MERTTKTSDPVLDHLRRELSEVEASISSCFETMKSKDAIQESVARLSEYKEKLERATNLYIKTWVERSSAVST